jgi:hypothetical protein
LSLLADIATSIFDDVTDTEDIKVLQQEVLDLQKKCGNLCANPSLKLAVIQGAKRHQEQFTSRCSQESNVDENLQTEEERAGEDFLRHSNKLEKKRRADLEKVENDCSEIQAITKALRDLGPIENPEEPRDATRKHQLHKENVQLANILTIMSAHRQFGRQRQETIERLCAMVHSKDYSVEERVPDV